MDGEDRCVTECRPFVVGVPLTSSIPLDPDPSLLQLDLPDPEQDDISTMEFLARLEQAWAVCDRFDLQTEIWRGRILRTVRDKERRGGEARVSCIPNGSNTRVFTSCSHGMPLTRALASLSAM